MSAYSLAILGLLLICLLPIVLANIVGPLQGQGRAGRRAGCRCEP